MLLLDSMLPAPLIRHGEALCAAMLLLDSALPAPLIRHEAVLRATTLLRLRLPRRLRSAEQLQDAVLPRCTLLRCSPRLRAATLLHRASVPALLLLLLLRRAVPIRTVMRQAVLSRPLLRRAAVLPMRAALVDLPPIDLSTSLPLLPDTVLP